MAEPTTVPADTPPQAAPEPPAAAPVVEETPTPPAVGAEVAIATYRHDVSPVFAERLAEAEILWRSNAVPAAFRSAAGVLIAMRAAMAMQVPLYTVFQEAHVIEGKIGWSVNFIRAKVNDAGHRFRVMHADRDGARVRIIRHDDPEPFYGEFGRVEAAEAELLVEEKGRIKKDQWRKYPRSMMVARATAIAVREACPEVMFGSGYTADELGATTDAQGTPLVVTSQRVEEAAPGGVLSEEDREKVRQVWREEIGAATTAAGVHALYERAKARGVLDRPLMPDGTTVEGVLAERVAALQADIAHAAAEGSQDPADAVVVDAEVVEDSDASSSDDGAVGAGDELPHATPHAQHDTAPESEQEPADPPLDSEGHEEPAQGQETSPPPSEPDAPALCRNTARRRGVSKLLAERFGPANLDTAVLAEFGRPMAQVATEALLKWHLSMAREGK